MSFKEQRPGGNRRGERGRMATRCLRSFRLVTPGFLLCLSLTSPYPLPPSPFWLQPYDSLSPSQLLRPLPPWLGRSLPSLFTEPYLTPPLTGPLPPILTAQLFFRWSAWCPTFRLWLASQRHAYVVLLTSAWFRLGGCSGLVEGPLWNSWLLPSQQVQHIPSLRGLMSLWVKSGPKGTNLRSRGLGEVEE
jgi:hypothetical protein